MEDEEKMKKAIEEFNKEHLDIISEQLEIIRDPIIAFLIVKIKNGHDSFYINTVPITTDWNNFNEDNSVGIDEEIIGVIPAPQYSYMVSGLFPGNGVKYPATFKSLGYEFEGAYCPDWKKELERRIKNGEIEDSLGNGDDDEEFSPT